MVEMYYLLSKDIGDGPYLMGCLKRILRGEYTFRYLINRETFPEWFMSIPDMEDIRKVYETKEVKDKIIHRVTPREGTKNAKDLMEQFGMTHYDEWQMLLQQIAFWETVKTDKYPLSDSHQIFYFYETIPRKVNRYD